ncbi:MAG: tetratricopeptide repeat protein [Candidatus Cloacimonadaceae bacterium]|jgi:tetratricopeptide (TPR) repeat protein
MKKLKPAQKIVLICFAVILLLLCAELLLRPRASKNTLATLLYNWQKYRSASKIWDPLAEEHDSDAIPKGNAAKARYRQGDYDSADQLLDEALKDKELAQLHYDRGNAQYRKDDLDKALESYKAAMLADPDDQDAKSNYELVLNRKGYKKPQKEDHEEDREQDTPQNDYDNTLNALDEQESLDRQKQEHQAQIPKERWW